MNMAFVQATQGRDDPGLAPLPGSMHVNRRIGQWLRFRPEGRVDVFSGKVELGQGILTALAQIVAEELDLRLDQVRMIPASTSESPNEAVTSGSLSVQESGSALRQACAEARQIYLRLAADTLDTPEDGLQVRDGQIIGRDGRSISYWTLANERVLDREATGEASPKRSAAHVLVGTSVRRLDLPDKVFGRSRFIHDLRFDAMLYGGMVRPPSVHARLVALREPPTLPVGARIVRDGTLLAALANSQRDADRAAAALAACAEWEQDGAAPAMPDEAELSAWLKTQPVDTRLVDSKSSASASVAARTIKAAYERPFIAHASLGPSCALAQFDGDRLQVWTHSQGIYNLRKDLALAFGMSEDAIIVRHVEGAGCYGHNGADDVAFDAAWLARCAVGEVVRVRWTRADELTAAPFGPAMAVEIEADLDAEDKIIGWRHAIWSNGHSNRPGRASAPALLGSWHLERRFTPPVPINAPLAAGGGAERNAVPSYDLPAWQVVGHRVLSTPIRTSALRALGAFANVFAVESFMDELAHELGQDPVEFRLGYTGDARAREVIRLAVERSGWRRAPSREGGGWGIGYARYKNTGAYCAVVADIQVEEEVRVARLTIAVDVGTVINPDGVASQVEGGAIQATSWALKEAVRFDRERITSDSWESYPILRFSEVPEVDVIIVPSAQPSLGAGECALGPSAGAIANAVFDALGVRVRELPITAARIMALIAD